MTQELPEYALSIFVNIIMPNIEADNDHDFTKCWLWPEEWPPHWGEKPKGISISHNGKGYAQFVYYDADGKMRTAEAHTLSRRYYNKKNDASLTVPEYANSEWAGKDHIRKAIKDEDGIIIEPRRVVRHAPCTCTDFSCVNPFHLDVGTDVHNRLDEYMKTLTDEISQRGTEKTPLVINDFHNGDFDVKGVAKRHGISVPDVLNIVRRAGLPLAPLLHDFNPTGFRDERPKRKTA